MTDLATLETNNYKIHVQTSEFPETSKILYHIVNKDTGVTEVELESLPRAVKVLHIMQEEYDEVFNFIDAGGVYSSDDLNPFKRVGGGEEDVPMLN